MACVFAFLKTINKKIKELAQCLFLVCNSAKPKDTNLSINPVNSAKKGDLILSLSRKFDQTLQIWVEG